ncbi:MAG: hypothetical protein WDW36_002050 [Sanguina aurantia]
MKNSDRKKQELVDAFTTTPLHGNPAAVMLLGRGSAVTATDTLLQAIAAENNLPETAFIQEIENPAFLAQVTGSGSSGGSSPHASTSPFTSNHTFGLRWFTPVCEVPLCGHATLAAAAVLFSGMDNPSPVIHFRTASGTLSITKVDSPATQQQPDAQDPTTTTTSTIITTSLTATHGDHLPAAASVCPAGSEGVTAVSGGAVAVAVAGGGGGRGDRALQLEMSLPLAALTETPAVLQRGGPGGDGACVRALLAACVGDLVVEHIGFTSALGLNYLMLVLAPGTTQQQLRDMRPDTAAMMLAVSKSVVSGVVVTLHEDDSEFDFVSRFFGPWMGITEDPVTGSAHTVLGPYWADRLGKTTLSARQCSARGGELTVRVDESAGRVLITGSAVIVIRGSFTC